MAQDLSDGTRLGRNALPVLLLALEQAVEEGQAVSDRAS